MNTKLEVLDCPNCGAPLDVKEGQEIVLCLYCDSSIRITRDKNEVLQPVTTTEIPSEVMGRLKELIMSGKRDEAVDLYAKTAKVTGEEAVKAVQLIYDRITTKIILDRPLSAMGYLLTVFFISLFIASFYAAILSGVSSDLLKIVSWVLLLYSAISLLAVSRAIITTIRYLPGKWADAKLLKFAQIGQTKNIAIFKMLIEVQPKEGENFQTQIDMPVRTSSIDRLSTGAILKVKYLPNDRNSVISFAGHLKKN